MLPVKNYRKFWYLAFITLSLFCLFLTGCDTSDNSLFSFGVITDVQYCPCAPSGAKYYESGITKLPPCIDDLNKRDLVFTIQLGDIIDRDFSSFDVILPLYNQLTMPHYSILGNHEYSVAEDDKQNVLSKLGMDQPYYEFSLHETEGWRFIVLNGTEISHYANAAGSDNYNLATDYIEQLTLANRLNRGDWNGALSITQLDWLDTQLDAADQSGERVIVLCHFPTYPHLSFSATDNLWNDIEVVSCLESHHCVAAYFCGHYHAGGYAENNGIHYVIFQAMLISELETAYAVVTVFNNRIEIDGFGRVPDRVLTLRN